MRIQKFALSALFLFLPLSVAANDVLGVYVSGKAGASIQRQTDKSVAIPMAGMKFYDNPPIKSAFGGGLAVGYDFNPHFNAPFRTEVEYYTRVGKSMDAFKSISEVPVSTKVSTQTLMANGYWDIHTEIEGFKPFVSAGLGAAFNKMKVFSPGQNIDQSGKKNQFSWSVGAGMGYEFFPSWVVELGYRYLNAGKSPVNLTNQNVKIDTKNEYHDFNLGLRYTF